MGLRWLTSCGAVNEILLWDMYSVYWEKCPYWHFLLVPMFIQHSFNIQSACKYDNQIGQAAGGFYSFSLAQ